MSQDEIIQAMRNLGGKDLFSKDIEREFKKIHFTPNVYSSLRLGAHSTHTAFSYGLRRMVNNGCVTRRLVETNTTAYRTLRKFVYSLVLKINERLKFNILYVDPPWKYKKPQTGGTLKSGASQHYNTLSFEELTKLPIHKITEKNCILFLWVTNPFIREGLELLDAWGFEYKTMLTWVKKSYGLGYYYRSKTEHILLGIKGKVKAFRSTRTNIIHSQKTVYRHSEKPEVVRDLIDELDVIANPKKLEIFARRNGYSFIDDKSHWTFIGNEVDNGIDIRERINELADTK